MVKDCLADTGMDNKSILKCRNMFAVGLVCWLFNRDLKIVEDFIRENSRKKPEIAEANIRSSTPATTTDTTHTHAYSILTD